MQTFMQKNNTRPTLQMLFKEHFVCKLNKILFQIADILLIAFLRHVNV